jgi:2-methylcitrate dehydratase
MGSVIRDDEFIRMVFGPLSTSGAEEASLAVADAVAVVLGTCDHDVARISRGVHSHESGTSTIWGVSAGSSQSGATIANGAALRCYDFNDLVFGQTGQGAHPSDIVPLLFAISEIRQSPGRALLRAVSIAYSDIVRLVNIVNVNAQGWDYANLVGLGSIRAILSILGGADDDHLWRQAMGIFGVSHLATNELESGELDADGNLTMWKRFNGSSACLAAYDACVLALSGVRAPVSALTGSNGFISAQGCNVDEVVAMAVSQAVPSWADHVVVKRWPVGSRAQSAIASVIELRSELGTLDGVESIEVVVPDETKTHLVRDQAYEPHSRETADHSLPYTLACALVDGDVTFGHFDDQRNWSRSDLRVAMNKISVLANSEVNGSSDFQPNSVQVVLRGGERLRAAIAMGVKVGVLRRSTETVSSKWDKFAPARLGDVRAREARDLVGDLAEVADIREFSAKLVSVS